MTYNEDVSLKYALESLGVQPVDAKLLKRVPDVRQVVRIGEVIVKAFANTECAAWSRELTALRKCQLNGLAPRLVASGEYWIASRRTVGVTPNLDSLNTDCMHKLLGHALAQLHSMAPEGLEPWSVADRLQARLSTPPLRCPAPLICEIRCLTSRWLETLQENAFVHGDWGISNVLVSDHGHRQTITILDFEDSHLGDIAEDFRWPGLQGPESNQLSRALNSYPRAFGACIGARIAIATVELCLDALGWDGVRDTLTPIQERCLATLRAVADGWISDTLKMEGERVTL